MPVPSPMRMPSARRSNGRITPVGLRALSWEKTLHSVTSWQWWTPPASTTSDRRASSSVTAWSTARSELAQAASSVYAGPWRSRRLATRDATRLGTRPIDASGCDGPSASWNWVRIASSRSAGRSGTSSATHATSWWAVRTRWSSRAVAGVR